MTYFPYMKNSQNISDDINEIFVNFNTYIEQVKEQLIKDINVSKKEILTKLKNLNFKGDIIIKSTNYGFKGWDIELENEKFEMLDTVNPVEYGKITNELKKLLEKIYVIRIQPFGKVPIDDDNGEYIDFGNLRHVRLIWNIENNSINLLIQDITSYEFMNI